MQRRCGSLPFTLDTRYVSYCWGVSNSIRPVKNWLMTCRGLWSYDLMAPYKYVYYYYYLSGERYRLFAPGPADATATLASVKSRLVLPLVLAHLGSPRQRAVKRVCVYICCKSRSWVLQIFWTTIFCFRVADCQSAYCRELCVCYRRWILLS